MLQKRKEVNVVARKKGKVQSEGQTGAEQSEKLTRLLALLVVKGESQSDKIRLLASARFSNTEIAELLGVTGNAVNIALHRLRAK
jgi:DNA-directed RNA polymerase specialized sigma24 family protein